MNLCETEIPTIIGPSAAINYPSATESIIVGISGPLCPLVGWVLCALCMWKVSTHVLGQCHELLASNVTEMLYNLDVSLFARGMHARFPGLMCIMGVCVCACMYVCMCVCMYLSMYTYTHKHAHICLCTDTHTHTHTHKYKVICIYTYTQVYIYIYTYIYAYLYMYIYIHTYIHMHIHTRIHVHNIHVYTHTHRHHCCLLNSE